MKLLLDTHTLLWFISGDARLSSAARSAIDDAKHDKFVSIASLWETAIKVSIGKITLNAPFDRLFSHQMGSTCCRSLSAMHRPFHDFPSITATRSIG